MPRVCMTFFSISPSCSNLILPTSIKLLVKGITPKKFPEPSYFFVDSCGLTPFSKVFLPPSLAKDKGFSYFLWEFTFKAFFGLLLLP